MVAEQTRMLSKEVGWTIILAIIMERLVGVFHNRRVDREEKQAVEAVQKEGLVPSGYKVALTEGVTLEATNPTEPPSSWVDKSGSIKAREPKSQNGHLAAVDASRAADKQFAPAV